MLKRSGLVADASRLRQPPAVSPWRLRVDALDRRLDAEEWARVIYHLCKHRGFHWISRAEEKKAEGDAKGEGGRVKKGLSDTQRRMEEKGYRSAAEMVLAEFPDAQRNKQGDYGKALSRVLLGEELALLFKRQRELGNAHASTELETAIFGNGNRKSGLFWEQKPPLAGTDLLKMLGKCTFEKTEYRAPKASFTAERHAWLTKLVNLKIVVDGVTRRLIPDEVKAIVSLPYGYKSALKWKQLHSALVAHGLPESFVFSGLTGKKDKDPLDQTLINLPAWQELRTAIEGEGLKTEWEGMAGAAQSPVAGEPILLDQIAWVLSVYKDGTEIEAKLRELNLPGGEKMVEALSTVSFDKFHNLSMKALRKIVPHMEAGLRYDEAVAAIPEYGHHSQLHKPDDEKETYLPSLYEHARGHKPGEEGKMIFSKQVESDITGGIPRNPVVLRALNQARKVCNALIREYGSPVAVHIEMARDLSRPLLGDKKKGILGRKDIHDLQEAYRKRNEDDKAAFSQEHHVVRDGKGFGRDFEKFQLYREQNSQCPYCQGALDLNSVLSDANYAQVDHALPYSRSYDDSKNNKVLVHSTCNQNKGNRTPYEYLTAFGGEEGDRWIRYKAWVEATYPIKPRQAKRTRLLRKDFAGKAAEEFRERNLNDTRYICRFFKNYVERYLKLAPKVGAGATAEAETNKRCVVLSGQTTAFLRARWGLLKVRGDSDRHHALDAAVVAACSHGMVKRLADYARTKELAKVRDGFPDPESGEILDPAMFQQLHAHFPEPWGHFRAELEGRLKIDDPALLREEMSRFGTYGEDELNELRPLFVSRAPQRRNGGAAHKDTIYAQPERLKEQGGVTQKVALSSLTLKDIDKLIDPHRNEKLYAAIRARLEAHGGKADKAFPADNPLRKPDRDGNPTGPVVRAVTMVIDKLSGIPMRGGIAKNDSMLRVDVFRHKKDGKFHLVPVYVHHAVAEELPNRAIVAFKDEDEWTQIGSQDFDFHFSVHPNDLLRITLKKEKHLGYFAGCNRSTGAFNLWAHDRSQQVGKRGMLESIGIKTAVALEKFHVDTLGNIYPAPPEQRRGLA